MRACVLLSIEQDPTAVETWTDYRKGMVMNSLSSQSPNDLQISQISDKEELNTKELAQRVSAELKRYSIPQAVFAQRVLCRSQGTLSDLLRNPKPWSKLKSGRETFRRMWKWLQEPEYQRMSALRLAGKYLQNPSSEALHFVLTSVASATSGRTDFFLTFFSHLDWLTQKVALFLLR